MGIGEKSRYKKPKIFKAPTNRMVKYKHAKEMAAELVTIKEGERIFAIVDGTFVAGDLIPAQPPK